MTDLHDRLRQWWDLDAATYDDSLSHALGDPVEAACWRAALARHLPAPPASVLDVGAGTGAISLLVAELGYEVTALDLSPEMLTRATRKAEAKRVRLRTVIGSATEPPEGPFDAVVERHLLWSTPEPLLNAVGAAGWSNLRVERLRDVEWARRRSAGSVLGWLEHVPRFAVL